MFRKQCLYCDLTTINHTQKWIDEILDILLPKPIIPQKIERFFDYYFVKILVFLRIIKLKDDFDPKDIQMRSACFIEEAKKCGLKFKILESPFGYTSYLLASTDNIEILIETLPLAEHKNKFSTSFINDKIKTKKYLGVNNLPIADGKSFWFWQINKAIRYGNELGFPLVVKPLGGSVSRHVTTDIKNILQLKNAIINSLHYSPHFIIEKYVSDSFVYRATVVDFDYVAIVKQIPANVKGDGKSTIKQLIEIKNNNTNRSGQRLNEILLQKIVVNKTTLKLLSDIKLSLDSVPPNGITIHLQKDPFP